MPPVPEVKPPEKPAEDDDEPKHDPVFVFLDALAQVSDGAELLSRPPPEPDEQPSADQSRQSVRDDELDEVEADRSGRDDHRAADAGKEAADRNDEDSVFLEVFLRPEDALLGDMPPDQSNLGDIQPVLAA